MRLSLTLVVSALVACFLPFVVATHNAQYSRPDSSLGKGKHASHKRLTSQVIAQRQHHVHRDLIDVCINIEAAVIVPILHLLDPLAAGLRLCLCLQDLNVFLDSDVGVLLGGILGGKDSLLAKIKLLLNTSPDAEQCTFPAHSHHACVAGHSCAFQCDPPYIKDASGTNCVCHAPMIECNGVCGNFPHGCSSAHPVPKRQVTGPITSYTAAKATCKSGETICGIPGRENPNTFECIDTTVSLDSCGGCVTPHRFADGPASPKGIDCGRLPGVSASSCSNSQCKVTHCRMGRELNEERNECVKVPTGSPRRRSLRMEKASKRDNNNIDVVLSTELAGQIHAYILLVGNLNNTCQALASTSSHATGAPSINYEYYVGTILSATLEALRSTTVVSLVTNIDTMVNVNTLALNAFLQCGCVDALGLQSLYHDLVAVVDAALTMQTWCSNHPASTPSDPSNPSTVSNTSPAHIIVGLDDLLHLLGIKSKDTHVDVYGLGPGSSSTVNSLLDGLVLGPKDVRSRSSAPSTTLNPALLQQTKVLVDAVIVLKSCESSLPSSQPNSSGSSTIDSNLLKPIFDAVYNLLSSHTVATYVNNVDTLVSASSAASSTLGSCGCVNLLGLTTLEENLNAVITAALGIQDWCSHNPVGVPNPPVTTVSVLQPTGSPTLSAPSSPSPTPSQNQPLNSIDTTIIIDVDLNALLNSFQSNALGGLVVNSSSIDISLLTQIQTVANLTLVIQTASSSLPSPASPSSVPSSSMPVDSNLVTSIIQATFNLCTSGTVGDLLNNLQVLVDVNGVVKNTLTGCSCVDDLGLGALVTGIDNLLAAVLNAQSWCNNHPVIPTPSPTSSTVLASTAISGVPTSSPISQPLDTVIHLDLDGLLSVLGLTVNTNSTTDLQGLLNTVVSIIANIQVHSAPLPPPPATSTASTGDPSPSPVPLTQGLVADLLQSAAVLLNMNTTTKAEILTNVKGLLNLCGVLAESMDHCGCVSSLGLEALENDVDALLDALLSLHALCNAPGAGNDVIKLDTHDLLSALGLDGLLQVKSELPGLGLGDTVNPLLHGLGLGGVKRWLIG